MGCDKIQIIHPDRSVAIRVSDRSICSSTVRYYMVDIGNTHRFVTMYVFIYY